MTLSKDRILVVDDAPDTVEVIERNLTAAGYSVLTAPGVREAVEILESHAIDVVITDLKMPGISGLDLVRHVRENCPESAVLMITGYPSLDGAVRAVKAGAEDFLAKPFTDEELMRAVSDAVDKLQARRALAQGGDSRSLLEPGFVGESSAMRRIERAVRRAAAGARPLLVTGETGTGKELIARTVHYSGPRAGEPFVPVQLASIPADKVEAELFGRPDAGGFAGLYGASAAGTLYLDDLELAPPSLQQALVRVMESGGGKRPRFIASTCRDPQGLIKRGPLRENLYFLFSANLIELPPLRDRGDDVLLLARHFAAALAARAARDIPRFSDQAIQVLRTYTWPGNVRELKSVIEQLVLSAGPDGIDATDLPALMRFSVLRDRAALRTLAEVESEHIAHVLASVGGNRSRAAEVLGIDRKTLRDKVKRAAGGTEPDPDD